MGQARGVILPYFGGVSTSVADMNVGNLMASILYYAAVCSIGGHVTWLIEHPESFPFVMNLA